jgi:L-fuconolactonase
LKFSGVKIDSHQHFWKYDDREDPWITDEMKVIKRDFLPSALEVILARSGFDGCVAVQSRQNEKHNLFLLDLADRNNFIKGIVGWIDLQSTDLAQQLSDSSKHGKLKGFRHVVQAESAGFMMRKTFIDGVNMLSKHGFTYDLLIASSQLDEALSFVSCIHDTKIVLDHLAKPAISRHEHTEWREHMRAMSKFENVYCKVSGMVTEANWHNWRKQDFHPYLETVAEFFGPARMLYGSDWPVCLLAASYDEQLKITQDYFSEFSPDERNQIFGLTATKFYSLEK